jgi:hypothetical protein
MGRFDRLSANGGLFRQEGRVRNAPQAALHRPAAHPAPWLVRRAMRSEAKPLQRVYP